ncbi:hypothetical protein BKG84_06870 [Mycobacteroides chelonae]|uniref:Uncharacterized protein n=1 Tax=Mycobacteroides chelonae TaxID=1774 RepID=A0A1S1M4E1_MYCCH|nr:hypothetical protein BKG84_06870 [Mycobacteroides chelonae]
MPEPSQVVASGNIGGLLAGRDPEDFPLARFRWRKVLWQQILVVEGVSARDRDRAGAAGGSWRHVLTQQTRIPCDA